MRIKYMGGRPSLATTCSGRVSYYFGPENDFTLEITNTKHVEELLSSELHRFVVAQEKEEVKKEEVKPEEVLIPDSPKEQKERQKITNEKPVKTKKKGKKHG